MIDIVRKFLGELATPVELVNAVHGRNLVLARRARTRLAGEATPR